MLSKDRLVTSSSSLAAAFLVLLAFDAVNAQGADPSVNNCIQEVGKLLTALEAAFRLQYTQVVRTVFDKDAVVVHLDKTYRGHEQIEQWFRFWVRKNSPLGTFERALTATNDFKVIGHGWCRNWVEIFEYHMVAIHDSTFHYYIKELTFQRYEDYWGPFGRPRPG